MKTNRLFITTIIVITINVLCIAICAWQTACLLRFEDVFSSEHPDYISHSWLLFALLMVNFALGCGQMMLSRKATGTFKSVAIYSIISILMAALEVFAWRSAAKQHYHFGMLISDYGIQVPFDGGWLMLILAAGLLIATVIQLLIVSFSALSRLDRE